MIKLLRIDDRLVHGQVAFTWVPATGADCLLVANDKAAGDEFLKMTMGLAKPAAAKLLIMTVAKAAEFLNDPRSKNIKILALVSSIRDASTLSDAVTEITSVNFGGIRMRDGARLISKAVAITEDDLPFIRAMAGKGLELEIRQVPTDKKANVTDLI
jgi:PTS system mannose-specific IIB component/fructoselysine and glucoselysine-specific PTS system IIB component